MFHSPSWEHPNICFRYERHYLKPVSHKGWVFWSTLKVAGGDHYNFVESVFFVYVFYRPKEVDGVLMVTT